MWSDRTSVHLGPDLAVCSPSGARKYLHYSHFLDGLGLNVANVRASVEFFVKFDSIS